MGDLLGARGRNIGAKSRKVGPIEWGILGGQGQRVGPIHKGIIEGQEPKVGSTSGGNGGIIGGLGLTLLGAAGRKMGFIHGGIVHYWGPGAEKWGHPWVLGGQGPKNKVHYKRKFWRKQVLE